MSVSINTAVFLDDLQNGTSQSDCVDRLVGKPISSVEVRGEFFKEETRDQELQHISQVCQEQNWDLRYSIPEELFDGDKINAHLNDYLQLAAKYHLNGLKISLGNPSLSQSQLQALKSQLSSASCQVTIENQPNEFGTLSKVSKAASILYDAVPEIGYTFDAGNWAWVDVAAPDALQKLLPYVTIFHLKEIKDRDTILLDKTQDWPAMVKQLDAKVPVVLEYAIPAEQIDEQIELVNAVLK
ncbi:sugar phosphate isomerase/epimerase family protein [Limosilactobacillus sp.]|uniref:sugar phosphate isomerase/epimerase family protein n=1 Tax=Limosilactobacillus sp. TaxID=2773925 RepID=UPI00345EE40F